MMRAVELVRALSEGNSGIGMSKMSLLVQGIFSDRPGNEIENLCIEDATWRLHMRSMLILMVVRGEFIQETQRRGSRQQGNQTRLAVNFHRVL